ncbi:GNAT family N-acetyltransferase [Agromyces neolithicus]|uniref:GNAT family N-acetyltransferase n=1 Tax=Agromyces neolithicus TaxID=269420 RepID=A0ABN2MAE1_9MICO
MDSKVDTVHESVMAADAAAAASGVTVRELDGIGELHATAGLLAEIWGRPGNLPITPELLRAFSKAGNYICGAFDGDRLVGATIGFHSTPQEQALHSHIAGVAPALTGRSVGFAMKQHQRAWALARDIPVIVWTFDPLVARNAYFNLAKLGAVAVEYLSNFYGVIPDVINGDDETDRLLVRWQLRDPIVVSAAHEGRVPRVDSGQHETVFIAIPPDIESMRRSDPALAHEWRITVRERLTEQLGAGGRIVGFDRAAGYVVQPAARDAVHPGARRGDSS